MKIRNLGAKRAMLGLALAIASTASFAAVNVGIDGVGFVGKGDVQLAFGWNNKALQDNAGNVGFVFEVSQGFEAECTWWTGPANNRKMHTVTVTDGLNIDANLAYDARTMKQITGFNLNGTGNDYQIGSVPELGDTCHGEGTGATVTSVTLIEGSESGGLYVTFNGTKVALPNTPVVPVL